MSSSPCWYILYIYNLANLPTTYLISQLWNGPLLSKYVSNLYVWHYQCRIAQQISTCFLTDVIKPFTITPTASSITWQEKCRYHSNMTNDIIKQFSSMTLNKDQPTWISTYDITLKSSAVCWDNLKPPGCAWTSGTMSLPSTSWCLEQSSRSRATWVPNHAPRCCGSGYLWAVW